MKRTDLIPLMYKTLARSDPVIAPQIVVVDVLMKKHLPRPVHEAQVQVSRMQVHSGIEFRPRRVILHIGSYGLMSRARTILAQEPL